MKLQNKAFPALIASIFMLSFLSPVIQGRIYNKCALARRLYRMGMPFHELDDWMCLIEGESSFNTKAINPSNVDGSVDWGLFQINDRYWCKPADGRPSTDSCRMPCQLLLSDNIRFSVACAKYIRRIQGFSAWVAWNNRCQGYKPSMKHCFVHSGNEMKL